jgi:DNA polymerase-3 subunit beta
MFIFKLSKKKLLEALSAIAPGVSKTASLMVCQSVLIDVSEDFVTFTSNNLDRSVSIRVAAETERCGSALVNYESLISGVRKAGEMIRLDECDFLATISWGTKAYIKLIAYAAMDFPEWMDEPRDCTVTIPREMLDLAYSWTAFAVSTDSTRQSLQGISVKANGDGLEFAATDGHRMGQIFIPVESQMEDGWALVKIILPPSILQAAKLIPGASEIVLSFGDKDIQLVNAVAGAEPQMTVRGKLLEGPYPRYEQVIPRSYEQVHEFDRLEMVSALGVVLSAANKTTAQVEMLFKNKEIRLSAKNLQSGSEAVEFVKCDHIKSSEEFRIGFNGKYFLEILNKWAGTDSLQIKMNTPVGATVIQASEPTMERLTLQMPLRLMEEV